MSINISKNKECTNCVLSTSAVTDLVFDKYGICNYCNQYFIQKQKEANKQHLSLNEVVIKIKNAGKNKKYDCLLGISGGVDSSYLAYLAKQYGLRVLVVHYDNGWNSELAVSNIQNIINKLGFDLYTYVNDWNEFKDIQLSFLKASVVDIELITDHAIFATLYKTAQKHKINFILTGSNNATESILPKSWHHLKTDALNIKAIHKKFGTVKMRTYPYTNFFNRVKIDLLKNIKFVGLLDLVDYNKDNAKNILTTKLDWRDYGGKHYESIFTRFYQGYILPIKFKIDKRKAHLSSLILSGQITRDLAIEELKTSNYADSLMQEDKEFVLKKFGLTLQEFDYLMSLPIKSHFDYPSYITRHYKYMSFITKLLKLFKNRK